MTVKCSMPAGIAAAIAFGEYQRRNIRSMKIITVVDMVETTSGSDTAALPARRRDGSTSREVCPIAS